jgi:flagellum-specific ATP synthase
VSVAQALRQHIGRAPLVRQLGHVTRVQGLAIEASGPDACVGDLCEIDACGGLLAEVVGFKSGAVTLMAYGDARGVRVGSEVAALADRAGLPAGIELVGRVVDPFGRPLDGRPVVAGSAGGAPAAQTINPLQRPRIEQVLETGVRVIDALLTLGRGQRVGIFAGSGVGKSSLLGMICRHVKADVNVIALLGERGREVREFLESHLGEQGLARSVVVVATSEQPALTRVRAAHAAVAIARQFADAGRQVLLTMDSVTRLAMARREIGLACGEPATSRGYTPSVFAELPQLCERCGTTPAGGSVTALMTVLVEGDDLNDPIADTLRSILDGHIVLSRELAQLAHYPPVDVLRSASRLLSALASPSERELVTQAVRHLALLDRNRQMVDIGAYQRGTNALLDGALDLEPALNAWLQQSAGGVPRRDALRQLQQALSAARSAA